LGNRRNGEGNQGTKNRGEIEEEENQGLPESVQEGDHLAGTNHDGQVDGKIKRPKKRGGDIRGKSRIPLERTLGCLEGGVIHVGGSGSPNLGLGRPEKKKPGRDDWRRKKQALAGLRWRGAEGTKRMRAVNSPHRTGMSRGQQKYCS